MGRAYPGNAPTLWEWCYNIGGNVVSMLVPMLVPWHYYFYQSNDMILSFKILFLKWEIKFLIHGVFLQWFQHCHNIVTILPECCSLVVYQCWTPTIMQCSYKFAWTLCECWYIMSYSVLHQRCGHVVKLHNFPTLWQHCLNTSFLQCGHAFIPTYHETTEYLPEFWPPLLQSVRPFQCVRVLEIILQIFVRFLQMHINVKRKFIPVCFFHTQRSSSTWWKLCNLIQAICRLHWKKSFVYSDNL